MLNKMYYKEKSPLLLELKVLTFCSKIFFQEGWSQYMLADTVIQNENFTKENGTFQEDLVYPKSVATFLIFGLQTATFSVF